MTILGNALVLPLLRHFLETGLEGLACRLRSLGQGRRLDGRRGHSSASDRHEQHFGSLDDQLLSDLGLQRSEIRAAEYGILPGDQALHHQEAKHLENEVNGKAHLRA
jgi:hypothetical protein